jgi:hypothetical protein
MKIIPPKQTVFFTRATSQSPCLHETLATAAITSASECTRATSQSLLFFRNTYRGFPFNQLRMQKECADGNMIEKAG